MKRASYLVIVGSSGGNEVTHPAVDQISSGGLRCRWRTRDVAVFTSDDTPILSFDGGIVIGTLFAGHGDPVRAIGAAEARAIHASAGQRLIDLYWGGYVAVLQGHGDDTIRVIRDPSGFMPCIRTSCGSLSIFAWGPRLLEHAGVPPLRVDWSGLARHLLLDDLKQGGTALTGVGEVLPGVRVTISRTTVTEAMLWRPGRFAASNQRFRDEHEAARALAVAVNDSIRAWAGQHRHIVLNVSGGLDSSIVAASLAGTSTKCTYLTFATDDPIGDERGYARMLAGHFSVDLHEHRVDVNHIDIGRSGAAGFAAPVTRAFAQSGDTAGMELANALGADGFFNGGGGDNVFCYLHSAAPVADRLLIEGPGPGCWQTVNDVADLTRSTIWDVLRNTIRRLRARGHPYHWRRNPRFVSDSAVALIDGSAGHPWTDDRTLTPGRSIHVAHILRAQNYLDTERAFVAPVRSPLLSQPVIECCLRIPTWMWCAGGRNRQVARAAFAAELPAAIVARDTKGTPDPLVAAVYEANHARIMEMLLEGEMMQAGVLDRASCSRALASDGPVRGTDFHRIMALVDAEAWVRAWKG